MALGAFFLRTVEVWGQEAVRWFEGELSPTGSDTGTLAVYSAALFRKTAEPLGGGALLEGAGTALAVHSASAFG